MIETPKQQLFAWWVEIVTDQPRCTYYFGPFMSQQEAQWYLPGYLEDLEQEGHQGIRLQINPCQPEELTIFEESENQAVVSCVI